MARKGPVKKSNPDPDTKYNSVTISKFINSLMYDGKKSTAEALFYQSFEIIKERTKSNPLEVFEEAFKNIQPSVEVRSRRVGGATYQVPIEVRSTRREALGMRWLINSARARTGRPMSQRLYEELLDASRGQGAAVKRREDLHRMADANKAFVHYRW